MPTTPAGEPEPLSPDATPPEKKSRAGRDLPAAIAVGVGLGVVIVLSLVFAKVGFVAVVLVAGTIAMIELGRALSTNGTRLPLPPVLAGGIAILAFAYVWDTDAVAIAFALTVLVTMLFRLTQGADGFVRDVTAATFVVAYVPVLGSFIVLMLAADDGAMRVVTFILCTIASDIGGYAAGATLGKHPMAPTISPKKSWEGFGGSMLTGIVVGVLTVVLFLDGHWWVGVVLGIASVVLATLGDLCESLIKRDLGIKDMGDLLPGHGGIMDRLDSLLAVAPVAWLVLTLLVPVTA
ncbi:phosphatidate cytidylyltransferase [Solicola sp. PLA-1-18]|uniref:phosphatidate cytidylyltransferase n=1 Tax=Solicola sp. PLA-1-18 TaxID=3380532 RepID=UPI003B7C0486